MPISLEKIIQEKRMEPCFISKRAPPLVLCIGEDRGLKALPLSLPPLLALPLSLSLPPFLHLPLPPLSLNLPLLSLYPPRQLYCMEWNSMVAYCTVLLGNQCRF